MNAALNVFLLCHKTGPEKYLKVVYNIRKTGPCSFLLMMCSH